MKYSKSRENKKLELTQILYNLVNDYCNSILDNSNKMNFSIDSPNNLCIMNTSKQIKE